MKIIYLLLLTVLSLSCFSVNGKAQQTKIPKEPFQITDASTGKLISQVLIIPRYSSGAGVSTMMGEGPGFTTNQRNYLDKPFVYRTGEPFRLKTPKSAVLPLLVFAAIGKARGIDGILIVAPKYRPLLFDNLWLEDKRKLELTPVSDDEWASLLERKLNPLTRDELLMIDDYRFWGLFENDRTLYIKYNKEERELVRSFLQKDNK